MLLLHRQRNYFRAKLYAIVKINDVVVGEANATTRHVFPDAGRSIGAVDTVLRTANI